MCRHACIPRENNPRLNKEGPDEKHVGAGVAFTTPRTEAPETVLRAWKREAPPDIRHLSGRAGKTESG